MADLYEGTVARPSSWPLRRMRRHVATEHANAQLQSKMDDILARLSALEFKVSVPLGLVPHQDEGISQELNGRLDALDTKLDLVLGGLTIAMDSRFLRNVSTNMQTTETTSFVDSAQSTNASCSNVEYGSDRNTLASHNDDSIVNKCNDNVTAAGSVDLHSLVYFDIFDSRIEAGTQVDADFIIGGTNIAVIEASTQTDLEVFLKHDTLDCDAFASPQHTQDVSDRKCEVQDTPERGDVKHGNVGQLIGPDVGPSCKANIIDSCFVRPVADGSDRPSSSDVGRAPTKNQQLREFIEQIKGILALAVTLNGDTDAMLLRYRMKIEGSGGNVHLFDQAVAIARPMVKQKKLPKKSKSRRT